MALRLGQWARPRRGYHSPPRRSDRRDLQLRERVAGGRWPQTFVPGVFRLLPTSRANVTDRCCPARDRSYGRIRVGRAFESTGDLRRRILWGAQAWYCRRDHWVIVANLMFALTAATA